MAKNFNNFRNPFNGYLYLVTYMLKSIDFIDCIQDIFDIISSEPLEERVNFSETLENCCVAEQ